VIPLEHEQQPPMRQTERGEPRGKVGRFSLRADLCEWSNGDQGRYAVFDGPSSVLVVPVFDDGRTVLVRQWRYPWGSTSWEVVAGTLEVDEDPADCAVRELEEEAGLRAERWTRLGLVRPSATTTTVQHVFLAQGLSRTETRLETYERDMIRREVPLGDALAAALDGVIVHAGSVSALSRVSRAVGLI
jgi:8-oxo-dGTP pyrophosphatase MutT (NUDIX family)